MIDSIYGHGEVQMMSRKEYEEFLNDLYHVELHPKLLALKGAADSDWWYNTKYLDGICRATKTINRAYELALQRDLPYDGREISRVAEAIKVLENANDTVNRKYLVEVGFVDALERHAENILQGIEEHYLPRSDIEVLRRCGLQYPESELRLTVRQLKSHSCQEGRPTSRAFGGYSPTNAINGMQDAIQPKKESHLSLDIESNAPRSGRTRFLKAIGSFGKGTVLTIADIYVLLGNWPRSVPSESEIIGGTVSIVTGLGDIVIGYAELLSSNKMTDE